MNTLKKKNCNASLTNSEGVSGRELKDGVSLIVPAKYGESEDSPFSFSIYLEKMSNYSVDKKIFYQQYNENDYGNDEIKIVFYEDADLPRYEVDYDYLVYQGGEEIFPNDGVYEIADYTEPITLKMRVDDENGMYCFSKTYTSLDGSGAVMRNNFGIYYNTSCTEIGSGDWQYGTSIYLDMNAKTTRVEFGIYDTVDGGDGVSSGIGYWSEGYWHNRNKKLGGFSIDFTYDDYDGMRNSNIETVEFRVNSAESYELDVKGYNLLEGIEYTTNSGTVYNKNDLEGGVTIIVPVGIGSSSSVFRDNNYSNVFGYNTNYLYYKGKQVYIYVDSSLNGNKPVYDVCTKYKNSNNCLQSAYPSFGVLDYNWDYVGDVDNYDAENNPIVLHVKGLNYEEGTNYNVNVKVRYLGELINNDDYEFDGLELLNGVNLEYFNEPRYVTFDQMFDGTFVEGGYDIEVTINDLVRTTTLMFNGEDGINAQSIIFSSDGLTFESYRNDQAGGMGSAAGGRFNKCAKRCFWEPCLYVCGELGQFIP